MQPLWRRPPPPVGRDGPTPTTSVHAVPAAARASAYLAMSAAGTMCVLGRLRPMHAAEATERVARAAADRGAVRTRILYLSTGGVVAHVVVHAYSHRVHTVYIEKEPMDNLFHGPRC